MRAIFPREISLCFFVRCYWIRKDAWSLDQFRSVHGDKPRIGYESFLAPVKSNSLKQPSIKKILLSKRKNWARKKLKRTPKLVFLFCPSKITLSKNCTFKRNFNIPFHFRFSSKFNRFIPSFVTPEIVSIVVTGKNRKKSPRLCLGDRFMFRGQRNLLLFAFEFENKDLFAQAFLWKNIGVILCLSLWLLQYFKCVTWEFTPR